MRGLPLLLPATHDDGGSTSTITSCQTAAATSQQGGAAQRDKIKKELTTYAKGPGHKWIVKAGTQCWPENGSSSSFDVLLEAALIDNYVEI